MDETSQNVENRYTDPVTGKFIEGNPGGGRPLGSKDDPIKKATKEIIKEYKENLAAALPQIEPVIIKKAIGGDMTAVKEIHDRVMDKARQPTDLDIKGNITISFDPSFNKEIELDITK